MPRTTPRTTTKLVKIGDACTGLGCGRSKFWRKWHAVFTDPRPPEERKPRFERKVYDDELAVAINEANKGPAAVLMYRRLMRRL